MFKYLEKRKIKKERDEALLFFYRELEKNWELWHVMDQRNTLDLFHFGGWHKIRVIPDAEWDEKIINYVKIFENYNNEMKKFKEYEQWYASDINNKTPENAKTLHGQKQIVHEKFKTMLEVVEAAVETFKKKLLDMGVLKEVKQ